MHVTSYRSNTFLFLDFLYVQNWSGSHSSPSLDYDILLCGQFCGKVLGCVDVGGEGSALIAAGGSDPILRIWDPRKPGC
jgi:ribosome biogenesis protein YTM1